MDPTAPRWSLGTLPFFFMIKVRRSLVMLFFVSLVTLFSVSLVTLFLSTCISLAQARAKCVSVHGVLRGRAPCMHIGVKYVSAFWGCVGRGHHTHISLKFATLRTRLHPARGCGRVGWV